MVLMQLIIPLLTWSVVNVTADINYFSLDTSQISWGDVCLSSFDVVDCLAM